VITVISPQIDNRAVGAALVVSPDSIASAQIIDVFREHALCVEVSDDLCSALNRLGRRKFEAVVVDSCLASQTAVLQQIHASASNRTAVTFAVTSGKDNTARALSDGFSFVLERPLTPDAITHTLRVAYGMIVRERRRYFRYPISIPVVFKRKATPEIFGRTLNISENGMALRTSALLEPGCEGTAQFTLPDLDREIRAECKVRWNGKNGEAGLAFLLLPYDTASELQAWLAQKLEELLPQVVAEKFRH
jgi:CheY-like chemotaxis protein